MTDPGTKTPIEAPLAGLHKSSGATMGSWFGAALPDRFADNWLDEYRAARETVTLIDKNYRAYLRFAGPDRVRYLNAILTNNVKDLPFGHGNVSLFLNPQGRIQAEIETYSEIENLFCVSYAMIRDSLVPALDKFIIMDDVTLTDETKNFGTLALEGPRAVGVSNALTALDLQDFRELEFREVLVRGIPCRIVRRSSGGLPGAEFVVRTEHLSRLWETLQEAVASSGGQTMGYTALNALRLEQGIPWFGYDFGDKQIPHEAGLQDSHISFTKGCYTGQEIVERVRSRGQVNRVRALLKIDHAEPRSSGTLLLADGKEVGHITRSAFSPALQSAIAMAYVRRENSTPDAKLQCDGIIATVILPLLSAIARKA